MMTHKKRGGKSGVVATSKNSSSGNEKKGFQRGVH